MDPDNIQVGAASVDPLYDAAIGETPAAAETTGGASAPQGAPAGAGWGLDPNTVIGFDGVTDTGVRVNLLNGQTPTDGSTVVQVITTWNDGSVLIEKPDPTLGWAKKQSVGRSSDPVQAEKFARATKTANLPRTQTPAETERTNAQTAEIRQRGDYYQAGAAHSAQQTQQAADEQSAYAAGRLPPKAAVETRMKLLGDMAQKYPSLMDIWKNEAAVAWQGYQAQVSGNALAMQQANLSSSERGQDLGLMQNALSNATSAYNTRQAHSTSPTGARNMAAVLNYHLGIMNGAKPPVLEPETEPRPTSPAEQIVQQMLVNQGIKGPGGENLLGGSSFGLPRTSTAALRAPTPPQIPPMPTREQQIADIQAQAQALAQAMQPTPPPSPTAFSPAPPPTYGVGPPRQ